jgi:glycosyltransferase involved in cell wall biosynthesis
MIGPPRLALLPDFAEEGWPSMDLCAEMLSRHLLRDFPERFRVEPVRPHYRCRFTRLPGMHTRGLAVNADRLCNRMWDFPRYLRRRRMHHDLFHLCDHSYAQLVHELPAERTGVFCHDLDTFRCLLEPEREPRPRWFRAMTRRILNGFQKAAVVFHTTQAVRRDILRHGLIDEARLVQAPLGVAEEFQRACNPAEPFPAALRPLQGRPYVLHVGSCIPRKRIDLLLEIFVALRPRHPDLLLVKAGGDWTAEQVAQIERLRLGDALCHFPRLGRPELAALYRRARLVLLPSEHEGFGIPVIEALACGAVVAASDLPSLRESGGEALVYLPVADVARWVETVHHLLEDPQSAPSEACRLAQAERFSWQRHARIVADAYEALARGGRTGPPGQARRLAISL